MTDNTQGLEDILDTLTEKSADSDSRLGYVDAYVFAQEAKQALLAWRDIAIAEARIKYWLGKMDKEQLNLL